jgi:glycosyltransferase involved in cell wall biosynthesis
VVCPLGANTAVRRSDRSGPLPAGLEAGRYALFVSTIEPRKGHEFLYRVWLRLIERTIPQKHAFKLAFVGRAGWMTEDFVATVKADARLGGSIQFLDQVEDDQLERLYDNAAFCVYPSLYEGYGLPVVEAFSRGKALLASNGGSLAEVVGDLSPTLPPRDAAAWQSMLAEWITNPDARRPFEVAIRERFSHPDWEEASALFFGILAKALTPPP